MNALYPLPTVVVCTDPARRDRAAALATALGVECRDSEPAEAGMLLLRLTREHLELQASGAAAEGAIRAEFVRGRTGWRGRHGHAGAEALARAAGVRAARPASVIDTTAGLGRDAFVLAALGCEVTLVERQPVVAALLRDGLRRAAETAATTAIAARMELVEADARELLATHVADVVLVDPMHPPRRKAAAVKKEMKILQRLVGADPDAPALLAAALGAARQRVVVKRPRGAEPIEGPAPSGAVEGRSTRFDIYAGRAAAPGDAT